MGDAAGDMPEIPPHDSSMIQEKLWDPNSFPLLSASLFLVASQDSLLKTLYPLFLVSSAADECYSVKLAYTELYNKSAFPLSYGSNQRGSRKDVAIMIK